MKKNDVASMTPDQHKAEIIKLLRSASHRHDLYRVFADSMEMIALALANAVDLAQFDAREARYMQIVKAYSKDEMMDLSHILPHLVAAFGIEYRDYLGEIYMGLELGNDARGQFFTPYDVSRLMARMNLDESLEQRIAERGFVTIHEPAVGSAGMVIGIAEALQERGINFQQCCHVTCLDVDIKTVHMAFIQLSLIGMPAVIVHGNTLTLETWGRWYTPFHILHGWEYRLRNTGPTAPYLPAADNGEHAAPLGQMELFA